MVEGADPQATTPMRTARNRCHLSAVDGDRAVFVGVPLPSVRRPDRHHDFAPQDLRQRLAPNVKRRERKRIDANVVVFPKRPRCVQRPRLPFLRFLLLLVDATIVIHGIRNTEQRAAPFTGLLQEMPPSDAPIVFACKPITIDIFRNRIVHARNQATVNRHTNARGEIALGGTERHLHPLRRSPRRRDSAVLHHQSTRRTTRLRRANRTVVRRRVPTSHHPAHIDRPVDFRSNGVVHHASQRRRIETEAFRFRPAKTLRRRKT